MNILLISLIFLLTPTLVIGLLIIIEEKRKKQIQSALKKSLYDVVNQYSLVNYGCRIFQPKSDRPG